MRARSVARPITPPRASTSRTTVPLAMPPMAGLQDIWPIVSRFCVSSRVRAPARAAPTAASLPAWPPPITMTSNRCMAEEYAEGNPLGHRKGRLDECGGSALRGHVAQWIDAGNLRARHQGVLPIHPHAELQRAAHELFPGGAGALRLMHRHVDQVDARLVLGI